MTTPGADSTVSGSNGCIATTEGQFDPVVHLEDLLAPIGLSTADAGGAVTFQGEDPIAADKIRLGASIGIPMMAGAVGAAALHRIRNGVGQDLHLDLRQAIHHVAAHAFWHPTINGDLPEHALIFDNPFLLDSYRTRDGRTIMASGVYPHLAAKWSRFLDVPMDREKVAAAFALWDAFELEEAANAVGLPLCVARTPEEWLAHPQGALLASQPVIGLKQIGDASVKDFGPSQRPLDGIKVLSFTHAVAGPTVGRTLAEQGADVLCGTRVNDYEHAFIYVQANIGARSALIDLGNDAGRALADELLAEADIVVNNHRGNKLERLGLDPVQLAERHPGLTSVSVTCYGSEGPWADRGGFDMNGSAASGLMAAAGTREEPKLPVTGMINDFITGYMGAAGATAALVKRATVGGSWHVTVNLTRNAMFYQSLGLVDPALAGSDEAHNLRAPLVFEGETPPRAAALSGTTGQVQPHTSSVARTSPGSPRVHSPGVGAISCLRSWGRSEPPASSDTPGWFIETCGIPLHGAIRLIAHSFLVRVRGRKLAHELGATHTVLAGDAAVEEVRDITGGGVDFAIEAAGLPGVVEQAFSTLVRTGSCAVLGVGDGPLTIGMREVMLGRTLRGVIEGDSVPHTFIPALAELYRQGRCPLDRLVTRYPLDDINRAATDAQSGTVVKALIMMS